MSRARAGKEIWSDRPGESWPSVGHAASALGCSRNAISGALNGASYTCAGRRWFSEPPEWARREAIAAERRRCAGIRCHPGRFGKVVNGTDARTGTVYINGQPVAELAWLAKGAAA